MSISRVRSAEFVSAGAAVLIAFLLIAPFIVLSASPAPAADEHLAAWNKFIKLIEKKDAAALNEIVSQNSPEEFLTGIGDQMKSKDGHGLAALKKMKYLKTHRAGEDIIKLGFEVSSGIEGGEYLWVVMKKEKNAWKFFSFEPAYSLKFHQIKIAVLIPEGATFKELAGPVVDILKKRLDGNKYTNYNFSVDYDARVISLEISGIDSQQSFTDFITRRGYFSLRRVIGDNEGVAPSAIDELFEYTYFAKKKINKFRVLKEDIVTNEAGRIAAAEVTFSGLRVPQVQIDLNTGAREKLAKYTAGFAVKETEEPKLTLACVLDYKVLGTFKVGARLSSGRFWIEDITLVQAARALNSVIAAGPLPARIEIKEFKEK
jgi:hypothetical protein